MTLEEKLHQEKIETENYIGYVEVWRDATNSRLKKIRTRVKKKRGRCGLLLFIKLPPREINSNVLSGLYSEERYEQVLANMEQRLQRYEQELEKEY